jgi:sortase B
MGFINGAQTSKQTEDLRSQAHGDESEDPAENENEGNNTENNNTNTNTETNVDSNNTTTDPATKENDIYDDVAPEDAAKNQIPDEEKSPENIAGSTRSEEDMASDPKSEDGVNIVKIDDIKIDDINYLKVNLDPIIKLNKDTKGWIYFPGPPAVTGLPIDISIVQAKNNDYYLSHSFDKTYNVDGWVFADSEVDMDNITGNYNTVIYGHARSYEMFGGLKNLGDNVEWYTNANNHFIKINTATEETVWQIFSWYETNVNFNYIKTNFVDSEDFIKFATEVQSKSSMPFFEKFEFTKDDRILTLSTCKGFNKDTRVAVHAKLVKSRKK